MSARIDPAQADLLVRLRAALADQSTLAEIAMFGGRSMMIEGRMLVAAGRDGSLLVRVPASRHEALIERVGAATAQMGPDRSMGPGWIRVAAEVIEQDAELQFWLATAFEQHRQARS